MHDKNAQSMVLKKYPTKKFEKLPITLFSVK